MAESDRRRDRCSRCGTVVEVDAWHPVRTAREPDGSLVVHTFCSVDCREAWERPDEA